MPDPVLLQIDDGVARVTLNRPAVLNAINTEMKGALEAALRGIAADSSCRVVILAGNGPGFMAGGDVREFEKAVDLAPAERRVAFERRVGEAQALMLLMRRLPIPVVASVHGAVAGFGMSLMMAADLALAAADTVFTLAYCHLGLSPDGGATFFLPRQIGAKKAMEIALLGERFDAATALALGLVNRLVPAADLATETDRLAQRLSHGPAAALAATKRLLVQSLGASIESQLQAEQESFAACAATADFAEGVAAFLAKRPPRFGRS